MSRLIAAIVSRAGSYLALLLLIIVLLFAFDQLKDKLTETWTDQKKAQQNIDTLEEELALLEMQEDNVAREMEAAEAAWLIQQEREAAPYRTKLREIEAQLEKAGAESLELQRDYYDFESTAKSLRDKANVAKAARDELQKESRFTDIALNRKRRAALAAARMEFNALDKTANLAEAALADKWKAFENSPYEAVVVEKRNVRADIDRIFESISPAMPSLRSKLDDIQQAITDTTRNLDEEIENLNKTTPQLVLTAISAKFPLAISILLGIILAPLAIKTAFYYGLAPMASRLPPIHIISDPSMPEIAKFEGSAVSVDVPLASQEELVIHPDFLQSSNQACEKRTRWLLNARLPFSSLASGMFFLTSIRPKDTAKSGVVVSSLKDPLGEVGIVEIPEGAAMVVQPRALAGLVKLQGKPVQVSRHWRLNSAHAWLTLQLRYLVFHGPCRLILKGCRGVRVERPDSAQARLINQAATLGFNANLGYKTVRTETFFPYLQGKEDLFNDLFLGDSGYFVYEELPNGGRKSGIIGRGLEGVTDAFLKAFGI